MELNSISQDYINLVISLVLPLVATLIAVAVVSLTGRGTWEALRVALGKLRPYVDQPTDRAIQLLSEKTGIPPAQIVAVLTAGLDALAKAQLPPVEAVPLAEVPRDKLAQV